MNEYLLDPNICPASLDENDEPTHPNGSAHRWDEDANPITCAECGTEKTACSFDHDHKTRPGDCLIHN